MSEREDKTIKYYNTQSTDFFESISTADMVNTCDKFLSFFSKPAYILDLGCGTGRDSKYFISRGHSVLPVDASEEMCKIATKESGVTAHLMLFDDLDYTETFDGVWACASLLHAERVKIPNIICKINKALKNEGILYMSFKYGESSEIRNGRLFTDMTEKDIPFLCNPNNGFDIITYYVSDDMRPERSNEKWLNIIARKIKSTTL